MKRAVLIFLTCGASVLNAQTPRTDAATAFAIAAPDENSPFFLDSQKAQATRDQDYAGRDLNDTIAQYPQSNSPDSAVAQLKNFFSGMFASVDFGPLKTPPTTQKLDVDPAKFPLQDRRELTVTYTVKNNTKKLTRLEYPTTQRMDIITTAPDGTVLDRWSDDRAFQPEEGIVIINPKERIEYQEKIPTRDMKAGDSYRVEAYSTSQEKFTAEQTVNPE